MSTAAAAMGRLMSEYKGLEKEKWVKIEVTAMANSRVCASAKRIAVKGGFPLQVERQPDRRELRECFRRCLPEGAQARERRPSFAVLTCF